MSRNGLQRVEYYSVLADDSLAKTASAGIALLRDLVEPIDLDGWRESYSHEITSPDLCGSRWWDYKSVQTEA